MKIFCNNTKNIIIVAVFAIICLVNDTPAEAECYFSNCPQGYTYINNQIQPYPWSPYGWACFPCTGYGCFGAAWTPTFGFRGGMVCSQITSYFLGNPAYPLGSCMEPGSYVTACNAECAPNHFNCKIGPVIPGSPRNGATGWEWACAGFNGRDDYCFESYPPVNGTCSSPANHLAGCANGTTQVNLVTSADKWTWGCNGLYGGTNTSAVACVETNCAPNICVGQTCTNASGVVSGTRQPDWEEKCVRIAIDCTQEYCESTIPDSSYICTLHDNNGCSPDASCDASTKCPAPLTQNCLACPRDAGGWREVSP